MISERTVAPDRWQNGFDEAVARLRQQVSHAEGEGFPLFDARDREALAYLLGYLEWVMKL